MKTKFVLPLAYTPPDCNSIVDWRPFGNQRLIDMVEARNDSNKARWDELVRCSRFFTPRHIDKLGARLDIFRHDLSELGDPDRVGSEDFASIAVLLAHRDIAPGRTRELDYVRAYMQAYDEIRYWVQAGGSCPASFEDFFAGMGIVPRPHPPQPASEQDFLDILRCITGLYGLDGVADAGGGGAGSGGASGLSGPGGGKPHVHRRSPMGQLHQQRKTDEYVDALSNVIDDVRNASIVRNLSEKQSRSLAKLAAQQELALTNVIRKIPGAEDRHLVLNSIRQPVLEIALDPYQTPEVGSFDLIGVRPCRPVQSVSGFERTLLHGLGIENDGQLVVKTRTPHTQGILKTLGKLVEVDHFSADLPVFSAKD